MIIDVIEKTKDNTREDIINHFRPKCIFWELIPESLWCKHEFKDGMFYGLVDQVFGEYDGELLDRMRNKYFYRDVSGTNFKYWW